MAIILTIVTLIGMFYFTLPLAGFYKTLGMLTACFFMGLFAEMGMQFARK